MKWRRDRTFIGLRGQTEPSYQMGSAAIYGTGASIVPLDDWQRSNFNPPPPPHCNYAISVWVKRGHLKAESIYEGYSATVDEGKLYCEEWLAAQSAEESRKASAS